MRDWSRRPPKRRVDSHSPYPEDIPPFWVLAEAENLGTQKPRISKRYRKKGVANKHEAGFPFGTFPQTVACEEQREAKGQRELTSKDHLGGFRSLARRDSEFRSGRGAGPVETQGSQPCRGWTRIWPHTVPEIELRWIETNLRKVKTMKLLKGNRKRSS